MERSEFLKAIGDRIDQLVSLDVPSRNVIGTLYPMARRKSTMSLTYTAAGLLKEKVGPGTVAFIATGWPDRPHISPEIAETDGPPGAAALARSLHIGLGAVPVIVIEQNLVPGMSRVLQAAGFRVLSVKEAIACISSHAPIHGAAVIGFPTQEEEARTQARELIKKYNPSAVIAIEKGGMNSKGKIHTSRGADTSEHMAKADYLMVEAKSRGILTIGIGDGGNEIGMGVIEEEIKREIPFGVQCKCGCGGGIAPVTVTDVLVTASISNWGAYGISACLAVLLGSLEVLHDAGIEERILRESANSSFIDGITGYVEPSADGLASPIHQAFVTLLRETVRQGLRSLNQF